MIENGILLFPLILKFVPEIIFEENTGIPSTVHVTNPFTKGVVRVALFIPLLRMIKVTEGVLY